MDDEVVVDDATANMNPDILLNRLRSRAGHWHQLAKLVPALYSKGYDSGSIDESTGITPLEQNRWVVAGTVYDSLVKAGELPRTVLAAFDHGGEEKLYHFRFLPAEKRSAAARYIVANELDVQQCEILARAMKEWDRRPGERAGFTDSPGDCMAFKYLRDAVECRLAEDAAEKLSLAFRVVDSESARERLEQWRAEELEVEDQGVSATSTLMLSVLRLTVDELGFRPLPQLSDLDKVTVDELMSAPSTSQEGAFGSFALSGVQTCKWVALPQWKALALARHPVALPVPECSANQDIIIATRVKTDEEMRRMSGSGLLVVDMSVKGPVDPNHFYLIRSVNGSGVRLLEGSRLSADGSGGFKPVAEVLFLARPPIRESGVNTSELLQV